MSPATLKAIATLGGFFVVIPLLLFFGIRRITRRFMHRPAAFTYSQEITRTGYVFYALQVVFMITCVLLYSFDPGGLIGASLHHFTGMIVAGLIATFGFSRVENKLRRIGYPTTRPGVGPLVSPDNSLLQVARFAPKNFANGIELFNDHKTPMEFVVNALQEHAGLSRAAAIRAMLEIHAKGGILLPLDSKENASRAADAISQQARQNNHPLICRAVSVA